MTAEVDAIDSPASGLALAGVATAGSLLAVGAGNSIGALTCMFSMRADPFGSVTSCVYSLPAGRRAHRFAHLPVRGGDRWPVGPTG
jgi:hypothetical protein